MIDGGPVDAALAERAHVLAYVRALGGRIGANAGGKARLSLTADEARAGQRWMTVLADDLEAGLHVPGTEISMEVEQ